MSEELYEVNEFQVTLFFTLKALYYDFGESLPSNIEKKFEELIDLSFLTFVVLLNGTHY